MMATTGPGLRDKSSPTAALAFFGGCACVFFAFSSPPPVNSVGSILRAPEQGAPRTTVPAFQTVLVVGAPEVHA